LVRKDVAFSKTLEKPEKELTADMLVKYKLIFVPK
jgi:hypothetical protein